MGRFFIAGLLLALLGTELLAQCPPITQDAGSPHVTIPFGCDDILKKARYDLHQGDLPGELFTQEIGQCNGSTQCWPAFYARTITSRYFEVKLKSIFAGHELMALSIVAAAMAWSIRFVMTGGVNLILRPRRHAQTQGGTGTLRTAHVMKHRNSASRAVRHTTCWKAAPAIRR